jgi:MFS family permease/SepF-like predicted cell division protein (DUF552 family)
MSEAQNEDEISSTTQKNLKYSIIEGSFNSAATSIVDSYITPFLLSIGASNGQIGLTSSIKNLANVFAQLPGAELTSYMSRKKIWVLSSIMTRLFWIPIILIPLFFPNPVIYVIALFALASFFLTLKSPAWSSMMGDIVPMSIRGNFFGRRNMIMGIFGLVATIQAGILLTKYGFSFILAISILLGLASVIFFILINEPSFRKTYVYKHRISLNPRNIINGIKMNKNLSFFTTYILFTNFAVEIASPFVAVYMLKDINVGYEWFAILVAIGALSKTIFHHYWGRLADRYGTRRIMFVCGILISFVPFGYMLSTDIAGLMTVGIFNGFAWAGFDIVVFNYLLDVTPSNKRPGYVANHTIIIGMGSVFGAVVGAYMVENFSIAPIYGLAGLPLIFFVSFVLRLAALVIMPFIKAVEIRQREVAPVRYIIWEAVAVGPGRDVKGVIHSASQYSHKVVYAKRKIELDLQNSHLRRIPNEKLLEMHDQPHQKTEVRVTVEDLDSFSDIDRIVKYAEKGYTIFVYTTGMREKSIDELEHAIVKIKEGCEKFKSQVYFADDDWLLIVPNSMKLETN